MAAETTVALVEAIREGLPATHEWDERESALLDLAARQAADIDRLETDIAERGVRVAGRGGEVLNQAFCEVRQERMALARILGQVEFLSRCRLGPCIAGRQPRAAGGRRADATPPGAWPVAL